MVSLFDITHWNQFPFYNTGGTRNKKYVQGPDDAFYFFKNSYKSKEGTYYRSEFWSEIIASELGEILELDVLKYDIAIDENTMGCISKSMLDPEKEQLLEGGKYLQALDNSFDYEDRKQRKNYSFELIQLALEAYQLEEYYVSMYAMFIFDALIGNSDRHQENWAFIAQQDPIRVQLVQAHEILKENKSKKNLSERKISFFKGIMDIFKARRPKEVEDVLGKLKLVNVDQKLRFSPVYDNGSSLGRELEDEKILRMLENTTELQAYAFRGKSEIHWFREKLRHFTFLSKIFEDPIHGKIATKTAKQIVSKYNVEKFSKAVSEIDNLVPLVYSEYLLPKDRKDLIVKIVTLRVEKLKGLLSK